MEKKIMRFYWFISFLFCVAQSFFFATHVIFLYSKGLDLLQINLIGCFFLSGMFFTQVPTGILADLVGRKKSFVSSCFCAAVSFLIYYFSSTFAMFIIAELFSALAVSLYCGALEAWAVDSLRFHGFNGNLNYVFKIEQVFNQAGMIIGAVSGGYIATIDLALPWLCAAIAMIIVGIFSWIAIKEDYRYKGTEEKKSLLYSLKNIISDSIKYGIKNKAVFNIIIFGAIFLFSCQTLNMQWQIIFKDNFGFNTAILGWIFAGISFFISLGGYISDWFFNIFKDQKKAIIISQTITAGGILIASQFSQLGIVMFGFFAHELGRGIFRTLTRTYINDRIPDKQRATIISFSGMVAMMGALIGLLISGHIAKSFSISAAWFVSGAVLALSIPLFLKIKTKGE